MSAVLPPTGGASPIAGWLAERYDLLDEIGRGGASVVYRARDRVSGATVAVKLLEHGAGDAAALARFAREARVGAMLRHANVVSTLDAKERGGAAAFVTEYVAGGTLRAALREVAEAGDVIPYARVADVLRDVAAGVAHAHARRVVHCDLKPENIFVDVESGRALVADFGIAVVLDGPGAPAAPAAGTPAYMAPEQIAGRAVDERTDVYALGLVGWEMLAGRRPWEGEPLHAVLHNQQHAPLPPLAALRPDIPAYLLAAVEGALAKDPRARWRDGGEFLRRLSPTPAALPPVVPRDADAAAATLHFDGAPAASVAGAVTVGWATRVHAAVRRPRGRAVLAGAAVGVVATAAVLASGARGTGVRDEARPNARGGVVAGGPARSRTPGRALAAVPAPRSGAAPGHAAPLAAVRGGTASGRRDSAAGTVASPGAAGAPVGDVGPPAPATPRTPVPLRAATMAPTLGARFGRGRLGAGVDTTHRGVRAAEAGAAAAYADLVEAMRRSAGPGREPRAVQALVAEQRRWEADQRGWVCGVARDPACLIDRAARRAAALEARRRRFIVDPPTGPTADGSTPRPARAGRLH